jgi:hypothetical protein
MNRYLIGLGAVLIIAGWLWPWLKERSSVSSAGRHRHRSAGIQVLYPRHHNAHLECGGVDFGVVDAALTMLSGVTPIQTRLDPFS